MSWLENKKNCTQIRAFVLVLSTELTSLHTKKGVPKAGRKRRNTGFRGFTFVPMSPAQFFIMDGEDKREIFSEVGLLFSCHHQNSFYGRTEMKNYGAQFCAFVLLSPDHVSRINIFVQIEQKKRCPKRKEEIQD